MRQYEIFYTKSKTDLAMYAVEGRYGQIHDDIGNIDNYFEDVEKLKEFVSEFLTSKGGAR